MTKPVPMPPEGLEHDVTHCRGLMLAAALKPEALQLLLGCDIHQANAYQDRSLGRLAGLKARIAQARRA